jgi:hypothetical protein
MRYSSLVLVAILPGCALFKAPPVVRTVPPVEWVQDCPMPTGTITTNADLARALNEARASIRTCNIDKKALREWAEGEPDVRPH